MGRVAAHHVLSDIDLCARVNTLRNTGRISARVACERLAADNFIQFVVSDSGYMLRAFTRDRGLLDSPLVQERVVRHLARMHHVDVSPGTRATFLQDLHDATPSTSTNPADTLLRRHNKMLVLIEQDKALAARYAWAADAYSEMKPFAFTFLHIVDPHTANLVVECEMDCLIARSFHGDQAPVYAVDDAAPPSLLVEFGAPK